MIHIKAHTARAEVARYRAAREVGVAAGKMVPAKNTWSWRLCFIEAYPCGLPSTELHRKMDESWQNLIGLLGHLSREVLDGQFFALIVRLVGNAMVQLIRDEQVVRFVRQRCSHVTPRRASLNEEASAETGRRETARQSTHRNLRHSLEDLVIDTLERAGRPVKLRLSPTARAVVFLRAVVRELLQLLLLPLPS